MKLNLVLPCYNPPLNWEKTIVSTIRELSDKVDCQIKLIIVNDCAKTGVHQSHFDYISKEIPNTKILQHTENKGKGAALRTGVAACEEELIIFTDIDFPYTNESFISIFERLKSGVDVALGHRGENYYQNTPWTRKMISKSLRFVLKTFLRLPTDDSQCGIKGFNSKGKDVFIKTTIDRFLFDLEFIKLASKQKLNIVPVSVNLKPGVVFSTVNPKILLKEAWNFLKILFR